MANTSDKIGDIKSSGDRSCVDLRRDRLRHHTALNIKKARKIKVNQGKKFSDINLAPKKEELESPRKRKIAESRVFVPKYQTPVLDSLVQPEPIIQPQTTKKTRVDFLHPTSKAYGKEIRREFKDIFKSTLRLFISLVKFGFQKTKLFIFRGKHWAIKFAKAVAKFSVQTLWPFLKFSAKTLAHILISIGLWLYQALYVFFKWIYFKIRGIKYVDLSGYKQLFIQKRLAPAPVSIKRSIAGFLVLCLCSIFSIRILGFVQKGSDAKADVLASTNIAYQYLQSAQDSLSSQNYDLATYKFNVATQSFRQAQKDIEQIGKTVTKILRLFSVSKIALNQTLLEVGANMASSGEYLSKALEPLSCTSLVFKNLGLKHDAFDCPFTFTEGLTITYRNLGISLEKIEKAEKYLAKIDIRNDLPRDLAGQVIGIQEKLPELKETISGFINYSDHILTLLGHYEPKRYLVLFQNSRELRATGGFIGSYGLLDIDQGEIKRFYIDPEGPYRLDGQLKEKIEAPGPLRLVSPRWYMRDANWFLDFPQSAEKIMWFYERSGGATVDGIIALPATLIPKMLEITGPIEMPEYNVTITPENFFENTQYQVEVAYDKEENKPKKFIADLFPKLLERLTNLDQERKIKLGDTFISMLDQKDILLYFKDPKLEKLILDLGFGGEVKHPQGDYLAVVTLNIGGGKTDHVVKQEIFHRAEIKPDGTIIVTLDISRDHQGDPNNMWEKIKNTSYIKVYVPKGSKLLEADGFDSWYYDAIPQFADLEVDKDLAEIYSSRMIHGSSNTEIFEEQNKTVFANWLGVEAGQKKIVQLKYELPFKLNQNISTYSLFIQKQPGTTSEVTSSLFYSPNLKVVWHYSTDNLVKMRSGNVEYEAILEKDRMYAVVLTK